MFVNNVTDYGCLCKCCMFYNAAYSYMWNHFFIRGGQCSRVANNSLTLGNVISLVVGLI